VTVVCLFCLSYCWDGGSNQKFRSRCGGIKQIFFTMMPYLPAANNEVRSSIAMIKKPSMSIEAMIMSPPIVTRPAWSSIKSPLQILDHKSISCPPSPKSLPHNNMTMIMTKQHYHSQNHHGRRRHRVKFDETVQVIELPSVSSQNHRSSLFWSRKELRQLYRERKSMDDNVCTLGLYTPDQEKRRKADIQNGLSVVLKRSDPTISVSSSSCSPSNSKDEYHEGSADELLSVLYWECTRQNQWEATQRGAQLATVLQEGIYSKTPQQQPKTSLNHHQSDRHQILPNKTGDDIPPPSPPDTTDYFHSELLATLSPIGTPLLRKRTLRIVRKPSVKH
jgi:hypothetical protein